jgi:hypothetical protein
MTTITYAELDNNTRNFVDEVFYRASYHYSTAYYDIHVHDRKIIAFDTDDNEWVEISTGGEIVSQYQPYYS